MNENRYDVFLSYRHKPLDSEVTSRTLRFLETYRLPKALLEKGCHGIQRVFRDTEELPVSRILSNTIENALQSAKCLVIVCSKDTPSSEWVDREVATFIEYGKADMIFPLLIDGSPEVSFPPSLKLIPDIADRVMDVRAASGKAGDILKNASRELLKVIARVADCPHEEVVREDHRRRMIRTARIAAGMAALFLFVAGIAGMLWRSAEKDRQKAALSQQTSMEVLSRLTYGLPDRLAERPGVFGTVADILSENAAQIRRILEMSPESVEVEIAVAENEEKLSTALTKLSRYEDAKKAQQEALGIYETLAAEASESPDKSAERLASAHNNLGVILTAEGRYHEASEEFGRALAGLGDRMSAIRPTILSNRGRVLLLLGEYEKARDVLKEAAADLEPSGSTGSLTDAAIHLNLGLTHLQLAEYAEAEAALRSSREIYGRLVETYSSRIDRINALHADSALADCLTRQGRLEEAEQIFSTAAEDAEAFAQDRSNDDAQRIYSEICNNYGLCLNQAGRFAEADPWYRRFAEIQAVRYEETGTAESAASLALAWYNIAENAFKAGDQSTTKEFFEKSLELFDPVSEELGSYSRSEYLARRAYYEIIVERDYAKAEETALQAYGLQPNSVFVWYNLGYALLLNGSRADADTVFLALASLGEGALQSVELDFTAMKKAGINSPAMDEVLAMMRGAAAN